MSIPALAVLLLVSVAGAAYAQQIPDYYNPYAPIYTDKAVYTWTDKVHITIVAPSWNENRYGIDTIGGEPSHPIRISTSSSFLRPYQLTETAPNSGVFTGEVILTGFLHDTDGDGSFNTNPRTMGSGPTGGLLEANRGDGLTISFEFARGVVLTHTAKISWNMGTMEFLEQNYLASDTAVIRVVDPDMNLNPEAPDRVIIDVVSDSDLAGVSVTALETSNDSGLFEATVFLTPTGRSSGSSLHVIPGDMITAKYTDRTLPEPFSTTAIQDIVATATVGSGIPDMEKITLGPTFFADSSGNMIDQIEKSRQIQVVNSIQNNEDYAHPFTCIIQISDLSGSIISLSWVSGQLAGGQEFDVSQSWVPPESGSYKIESFVWRSLDDPRPLSPSSVKNITVQ